MVFYIRKLIYDTCIRLGFIMQWVLILTICMAEGTGCVSQPDRGLDNYDTETKMFRYSKYMHWFEELPTDWSMVVN